MAILVSAKKKIRNDKIPGVNSPRRNSNPKFIPNNRVRNTGSKNWKELKGEVGKYIIIARDLNALNDK